MSMLDAHGNCKNSRNRRKRHMVVSRKCMMFIRLVEQVTLAISRPL